MFPILLGKNNDLEKRVKTLEDSGGGGSGNNILIIDVVKNDALYTSSKTWKEIYNAVINGTICYFKKVDADNFEYLYVNTIGYLNNSYFVNDYWTDNENGYPYFEEY